MMKIQILAVAILLFATITVQQVYAPFQSSLQEPGIGGKAIPDWVKNQFEWYVNGQIDEKTLLTSMSWLVDNRVMFLSEKAAQEEQAMKKQINDLKQELEETKAAIAIPNLLEARKGANEAAPYVPGGSVVSSAVSGVAAIKFPIENGMQQRVIVVGSENTDLEALVQMVLRESYMETNKDLQFYADKVQYYNDMKSAMRDEISQMRTTVQTPKTDLGAAIKSGGTTEVNPTEHVSFNYNKISFATTTVNDIMVKGGTASAWNDGVAAFSKQGMRESVVDELQGIVVLCNTEIDKKTQTIDAELKMIQEWLKIIEEKQATSETSDRMASDTTTKSMYQYNQSDLDFITRKLSSIDQKINSLDTGIKVLEQKLATVGDDAQLANIDLQNALQKQQQTLQTLSNVSKAAHDTAKAIINNIRA